MTIYSHEEMASLKSERIRTLTKVFNNLPPEPIIPTTEEAYGIRVYRAGISEIRVIASTYTGNSWTAWTVTSDRVAKMRIKYLIIDDETFYTTFVERLRKVLDRMKLTPTHSDLCNNFLRDLITQLKSMDIIDVPFVKLK